MDGLLLLNVPCSQEFSDVLRFGAQVSCLWISVFLPVASRLLQLYSTDNKTSRLMVKRFSTVRDTQRGSQSYMKKKRGRREIEMSRRKGGLKWRETDLRSSLFPKCSPKPRCPHRFTELDWEEKGEGGNRGDLREKTESQKWPRVINTLLSKNGY